MKQELLLALGILSTSFLGSWHCAGMCGPIASLMGQRGSLVSYHLGRLLAYVGLGVAAGFLGQFFLNSQFIFLRYVSACVFGLVLIYMGLQRFKPEWFQNLSWLTHGPLKWIRKYHRFQVQQSGLIVGLLTAFLPCGWLYTYVTAAIATRNPLAGSLVMMLFWLGGLPALSVLPALIRSSLNAASARQQRIAGAILVTAGLYSILSFVAFH